MDAAAQHYSLWGDSAIELFSAIVVLSRFRAHAEQEQSERHAARIAAVLLFMLAPMWRGFSNDTLGTQ